MDTTTETPTVEPSLEVLSEAIGESRRRPGHVRIRLDQERFEIGSRNTSVSRGVIRRAERASITCVRPTKSCGR
jgi:hypothetical protein